MLAIFPLQRIERRGFDPDCYLAKKFKFKVVEVPVTWSHSEGTRISPLHDGTRMLLEPKTHLESVIGNGGLVNLETVV